jgi:glycerol kinase
MKIGLFKDYSEAESLLKKLEKKVLLVPSLGGFRIPYLRDLRGIILGLGLDTSKSDILSGLALGVSLHIATILNTMKKYIGRFREPLFSGGGYSRSSAFLQTLADITGMQVARPVDVEVSSFGVAKLLALSDGKLSKKDLREKPDIEKLFSPNLHHIDRSVMLDAYSKLLGVISRCLKDQSLKKIF